MKTLLLLIAFLLIASTIEAKQPFATKVKSYKHNSFKKHKPSRKTDNFVCVRHKKVNSKGLTK